MLKRLAAAATVAVMAAPPAAAVPLVGSQGLLTAVNSSTYGGSAESGALQRIAQENNFIRTARQLVPDLISLAHSQAAQLTATRALHYKVWSDVQEYICAECYGEWPCPTIAILDGNQR